MDAEEFAAAGGAGAIVALILLRALQDDEPTQTGPQVVASGVEAVADGVEKTIPTGLGGPNRRLTMSVGVENHGTLDPREPHFMNVDVGTLDFSPDPSIPVVGYFWRWDESQDPPQWIVVLQAVNTDAVAPDSAQVRWALVEA